MQQARAQTITISGGYSFGLCLECLQQLEEAGVAPEETFPIGGPDQFGELKGMPCHICDYIRSINDLTKRSKSMSVFSSLFDPEEIREVYQARLDEGMESIGAAIAAIEIAGSCVDKCREEMEEDPVWSTQFDSCFYVCMEADEGGE